MSTQLVPVVLFERGYTDLISVIPPNATLSPGSKITPSQIGKVPGRRLANGTWAGYNWRSTPTTAADVAMWTHDGANIGLRAGRFPGLDIDSLDETIALEVEAMAIRLLGHAPVRIGRPPKRLLMYQAAEPFTRMRMRLDGGDGQQHLIEMLGEGQQYLVHGIHPITKAPYSWDHDELPPAGKLTGVSVKKVQAFFDTVATTFSARGFRIHREGDGRRQERTTAADQESLRAPSDEELARAVGLIPNDDEQFPTREDYIRMGYAIRAAAHDPETGYGIFFSWAERWTNPRGNDPETVRSDWRRMRPPYSVGWEWIAGLARNHGYNNASQVFDAEGLAPDAQVEVEEQEAERMRVKLSEHWLAEQAIERLGGRVRFVPETGQWIVWDGRHWKPDDLNMVVAEVRDTLHNIASDIATAAQGSADAVKAARDAHRIEATHTLFDVVKQIKHNKTVIVAAKALDADPWIINTPLGTVDLHTGDLGQSVPQQLSTKLTSVGPDFEKEAPLWATFLKEATGGDAELEAYLQRFAGYALTGTVHEQIVLFLWGKGGTGKSTFVTALSDVMGSYAYAAAMDTFTASNYERHSTDIAAMRGARLVTASETEAGKRWDEQRLKQLTGGEMVTARLMRQDNFSYRPQFKLLFLGNHAPRVRDLDAALMRRLHIAGFTQVPAEIDKHLGEKLRAEHPQILAWMIRGALKWQTLGGLNPPESIQNTTTDYFDAEDSVGQWINEYCITQDEGSPEPIVVTETSLLFSSWREWANANGEKYPTTAAALSAQLTARGFKRGKHPVNRRSVFFGITLRALEDAGFPT